MGKVKREKIDNIIHKGKLSWGAGVIVFFLILAFYFIFNPVEVGFMPKCVFHHVTGLQCMGCGAQRMIHALLHADFIGAFRANALLFISLPFILFFLWTEFRRKKMPRLYARLHSVTTIWTVASILVIWFVVRNIIGI